MSDDPILNSWDEDGVRPEGVVPPNNVVPLRSSVDQKTNGKLELRPARLPDPHTIPPREWLYGTQLIRGFVSVLVAPGGTGKSAYALAVAISLAANRSLLGEHIFTPVNVAVFNLDDPLVELDRRVAAIQIHYKISRETLDGKLFLEGNDGHGLTLAAPSRDENGFCVAHPDEAELITLIKVNGIGLLVCDPFAESHTLEENSNPQMIQAMAVWRRIARLTNCAVLLVHHVRKGDASSIDAARGAKALTDSGRVGLLMTTMSASEAEEFGISEDTRQSYLRLDDAKRNMAAAAKAKWFQLQQVGLGNTFNPIYPRGDSVQAIIPWQPVSAWQSAPMPELNKALDRIDGGINGGRYSDHLNSADRWGGNVLVEMLGVTEAQASAMLATWIKNGVLVKELYYDKAIRKERYGLRANPAKRPGSAHV